MRIDLYASMYGTYSTFETTAHLCHLWFLCAAYKCTYLLTYLLGVYGCLPSTSPLSMTQLHRLTLHLHFAFYFFVLVFLSRFSFFPLSSHLLSFYLLFSFTVHHFHSWIVSRIIGLILVVFSFHFRVINFWFLCARLNRQVSAIFRAQILYHSVLELLNIFCFSTGDSVA